MIYVIANKISGKGRGAEALEKTQELLNARGAEYAVLVSEYSGHSTELTQKACEKPDCELIVAIGGDGTFSEVLSGMELNVPIAFIPAGTGNDFVAGAELPTDAQKVIDLALSGSVEAFDFLSANGRRCLNIAGTGFDVNVLLTEDKIRRFLPGKISYMLALLISLISVKFTEIEVEVDDGEKRSLSVLLIAAANGKYYGGGMPISLDAKCNDGLIDLVIIKKLPRIKIPYLFIKFFQGKLKEVTKYVEVCRCKKVRFSTVSNLPANIDGELVSDGEITVEISHKALKTVCEIPAECAVSLK